MWMNSRVRISIYVLTVCDNAKESCPVFCKATRLHHSFNDPARRRGSRRHRLAPAWRGTPERRSRNRGFHGKYWLRYGKRHRDDGPAIERADGCTEWWRNDRRLKPEQIRAIMQKNGDKAAEAFRNGMDRRGHAVQADEGEEALM